MPEGVHMKNSDIKIKSNFEDYYDQLLTGDSGHAIVFNRVSAPLPRETVFNKLKDMGLNTPLFGTVTEMKNRFEKEAKDKLAAGLSELHTLIVYDDLSGVNGEGKELLSVQEAIDRGLADEFAAEYIVAAGVQSATSIRYIQCGNLWIWIEYDCDDDWRANADNRKSKITVGKMKPRLNNIELDAPIFAIDFITTQNMKEVAVDLILNPILVNEEALLSIWSEKMVAEAITGWFKERQYS